MRNPNDCNGYLLWFNCLHHHLFDHFVSKQNSFLVLSSMWYVREGKVCIRAKWRQTVFLLWDQVSSPSVGLIETFQFLIANASRVHEKINSLLIIVANPANILFQYKINLFSSRPKKTSSLRSFLIFSIEHFSAWENEFSPQNCPQNCFEKMRAELIWYKETTNNR